MNRLLSILALITVLSVCGMSAVAAQPDAVGFRADQLLQAAKADPALKTTVDPLVQQFFNELGLKDKTSLVLVHLTQAAGHEGYFLVIHNSCQPGATWRPADAVGPRLREKNGWILNALAGSLTLLYRKQDQQAVLNAVETIPELPHTPGVHFSVEPDFLTILYPPGFISPLPAGVTRVDGSLKNAKVTMQLACQAGLTGAVAEKIRDGIEESFRNVDELNRTAGFNLWTRNACHFARSLSMKKKGSGIILTAKLIENAEELTLRSLLPVLARFVREMAPPAVLSCRQRQARLAIILNESLRRGESLEVILRRVEHSRQIPRNCPDGSPYSLDPDQSGTTTVRCAVHDGR